MRLRRGGRKLINITCWSSAPTYMPSFVSTLYFFYIRDIPLLAPLCLPSLLWSLSTLQLDTHLGTPNLLTYHKVKMANLPKTMKALQ